MFSLNLCSSFLSRSYFLKCVTLHWLLQIGFNSMKFTRLIRVICSVLTRPDIQVLGDGQGRSTYVSQKSWDFEFVWKEVSPTLLCCLLCGILPSRPPCLPSTPEPCGIIRLRLSEQPGQLWIHFVHNLYWSLLFSFVTPGLAEVEPVNDVHFGFP